MVLAGACVGNALAGTVAVNIGCGYLLDGEGVAEGNRLPVGTLCVLVADLAGDGFDPPMLNWAEDDDVLVVVSDSEHPAASGGTRAFDLAAGATEPGLFSRSLLIDPAQFPGRTRPVPVALRWFPAYLAVSTDVTTVRPAPGSPYGQFTRVTPFYPESGSTGWFIPLSQGSAVTLDAFASPELGGRDPSGAGEASGVTSAPQELRLNREGQGSMVLRFRAGAGLKFRIQRGPDLLSWPTAWDVVVSPAGEGVFTDDLPTLGKAFYRVLGPLPP